MISICMTLNEKLFLKKSEITEGNIIIYLSATAKKKKDIENHLNKKINDEVPSKKNIDKNKQEKCVKIADFYVSLDI